MYIAKPLRVVLSLALLAWVIGQVDWSDTVAHLRYADLLFLILFILITPINVGVSVWKWSLLLRACGDDVPFWRLYGIYVASQFFNNVLPSSVGGDVVRAFMINRVIAAPKRALGSIVVERFTGLVVLLILGVTAMLTSPALRTNGMLFVLVTASVIGSVVFVGAILSTRSVELFSRPLARFAAAARLLDKTTRFQQSLREYGNHSGTIVGSLALSVVFYAGAILNIWFVCAGIGQPIAFETAAIVVPVVLLVSLLPITVSGLGLTEWAFMVGFEAVGASGSLGIAAGLLLRGKQIVWSAAGYLAYLAVAGKDSVPRGGVDTASINNGG
jgi:uncharacterized protein (TIRG00374 family)